MGKQICEVSATSQPWEKKQLYRFYLLQGKNIFKYIFSSFHWRIKKIEVQLTIPIFLKFAFLI